MRSVGEQFVPSALVQGNNQKPASQGTIQTSVRKNEEERETDRDTTELVVTWNETVRSSALYINLERRFFVFH